MATEFKFDIAGGATYADLRATAKALALGYFPTWQFDNPNDVGVFALELHLHAVEKALWLANAYAQEFSIGTAQTRKNVEAHARNLGYPVKALASSGCNVTLAFAGESRTRTIGANSLVLSAEGQDGAAVYFTNPSSLMVGANVTTCTLGVVDGIPKTINAVGVGRPFQSVAIQGSSATLFSVKVDGVDYDRTPSLADAGAEDLVFAIEVIDDNLSLVVFGDGTNGSMPAIGAKIVIGARIGGGTRGNIEANTITTVVSFANTESWAIKVTANTAATGGADRESLDKIRFLAPRYRRAYDRVCTLADARTFAESIAGVARAHAFLLGRSLHVVIVPNGGGNPSSGLLSTVSTAISTRLIMGYGVTVSGPTYRPVNITVTGVVRAGFVDSDVSAAVRQSIIDAFSPLLHVDATRYTRNFGVPLNLSDIESAITANGSLKPGFSIVASPTFPVVCLPNQIPSAGTITVNVTGGSTVGTFESTLEF